MPQFVEGLGNVIGEASPHIHGKDFLDAFLGNRIKKEDETGTFAVSPLTGEVELESPGGFKLKANPVQRSVHGSFRFGGPDTSIKRGDPEQVLNQALGINPKMQYGPEPLSEGRRLMLQEIDEYLERHPYGYRFPQ